MITASVFEAKTKLSELLRKVQAGETVVITSGRDKKPVARLAPIEDAIPGQGQRLGGRFEDPSFVLPESFWEPLPEEELRLWNGEGE